MPASYRVLKEGHLVVELWSGNVSHDELVRHLMRRLHDPSIQRGASVIADGRRATFEIPEETAAAIANTHQTPTDKMTDSKVAMVVNDDVLVRANLFATRASEFGVKIMVFSHFDVACTWLELNPAETQRILDEIATDPSAQAASSAS